MAPYRGPTRGIRANNPGNIRHGEPWAGLAAEQTDHDFCVFIAPVYGIRAMVKILRSYARRQGALTIRSIIRTWAPPTENDTEAYIDHVADLVGLPAEKPLQLMVTSPWLPKLLRAIIMHENANEQPYSDNTITDAIALAFAR
jgi:hypothetical protein